ncbi:pep a2 [Streptomyces spongiae]|uniref:pep a2 n=1 Tax=Streptomyces spongiae TaxID=565072 RepID=UPI001D13A2DD|nr:pep a2 [Streptomyces spongiae]
MKTAVPCYYHLDVEVSPERVGQVRRILAAHLRYWDLDTLVETVCQGAELLLRAIDEHAKDKKTSIEMWWNRQHLITAFGQNDRYLRPDQDLRSCLVSIAALSDGWGCCATATGTKLIWFSQRARAGERAPLVPTTPFPTEREALQAPREIPVPVLAGPEGMASDEREREAPVPALAGSEGAMPDEPKEAP